MARTYRVVLVTEDGRETLYQTPDKKAAEAEVDRMNANFANRGIPSWVASACCV